MALSLEQKMEAIYWRSQGDSFSDVLEGYEITAPQFFNAVKDVEREDDTVLRSASPDIVDDVKEVLDDEEKRTELFNMGRDFLKERYGAVLCGDEGRLPSGVYLHAENAYWLVDIALCTIDGFEEADRKGKIDLIREHIIGCNGGSQRFFYNGKLTGLLGSGLFRKKSSPIAALELWDEEYCRREEEVSIFDLEQDTHIRFWDVRENGMWNGPKGEENAYTALNYTLNQIEGFKKADRAGKIKLIREHVIGYEDGSQKYFIDNGLAGLLDNGLFDKSSSPVAALKFWDKEYSRKNKEVSIFDLEQDTCIRFWEISGRDMWSGPDGEENAYTALNYTLNQIEGFKEADRDEKMELIREHVIGYRGGALEYFHDNDLAGLLIVGPFRKKSSPVAVLEFWDEEYCERKGGESMFDLEQDTHIRFWEFDGVYIWGGGSDGEENAYAALNYTLEQIEGFKEADRDEKIALIDEHIIDYGAQDFFNDNGMNGLMGSDLFERADSPVLVLEFWDKEYCERNGGVSMFDSSQDVYLAGRARGEFEHLEVRYQS